jgi:pimeloyl-ACP methyl ester carboxylesterase
MPDRAQARLARQAGQRGRRLPELDGREYLELFPDHTFKVIPNAGHQLFAEQPALSIEAMKNFLEQGQPKERSLTRNIRDRFALAKDGFY